MKKWPFEQFQHDPRIADGVFVGQRSTPVPLTNYVTYLKERAANETAPWVIFMSDVFDLYPELRLVSGVRSDEHDCCNSCEFKKSCLLSLPKLISKENAVVEPTRP